MNVKEIVNPSNVKVLFAKSLALAIASYALAGQDRDSPHELRGFQYLLDCEEYLDPHAMSLEKEMAFHAIVGEADVACVPEHIAKLLMAWRRL